MGVLEVEPAGSGTLAVGDKGLKKDALGFVSSCVIGVASTAPGYSLAASLGFVVAVTRVGLQAPAVLLVAFIPMLLIASAYYYTHEMLDLLRDRGRTVLEEALQRIRAAGLEGRGELVNDKPAEGLANLAASEGAQMVIVRLVQRGAAQGADRRLHSAAAPHVTDVPVLIVRGSG